MLFDPGKGFCNTKVMKQGILRNWVKKLFCKWLWSNSRLKR